MTLEFWLHFTIKFSLNFYGILWVSPDHILTRVLLVNIRKVSFWIFSNICNILLKFAIEQLSYFPATIVNVHFEPSDPSTFRDRLFWDFRFWGPLWETMLFETLEASTFRLWNSETVHFETSDQSNLRSVHFHTLKFSVHFHTLKLTVHFQTLKFRDRPF